MALISLVIVCIYLVISIFAPLLTSAGILIDYRKQVITNASLPPSFKPAGELVINKIEKRIADLEQRVEEQKQQQSAFDSFFDFGSVYAQDENGEAAMISHQARRNSLLLMKVKDSLAIPPIR